MNASLLEGYALWIVPVLLLSIGWLFLGRLLPAWSGPVGFDADPSYVYLLSGATLLSGHAPHHIDHPGTPLQVLAAGVSVARWAALRAAGRVDVVTAVLQDPEAYIADICRVLVVLNAAAAAFAGRRIVRTTGNLALAVAVQATPLLFSAVSPRIAYLSPEALLFPLAMCLIGLLAPQLLGRPSDDESSPALVGVVCGCALAVKLTFAPMLGLVFVLPGWRQWRRAGAWAVLTLAVCLLPVTTRLGLIVRWIGGLVTHAGIYGTGPPNLFSTAGLRTHTVELLRAFPLFFAAMALLAMGVARVLARPSGTGVTLGALRRALRDDLRAPAVMLGVAGVQTMLVLKHFGLHYLLPALPLTFVTAGWLVESGRRLVPRVRTFVSAAILALASLQATAATAAAERTLRETRELHDRSSTAVLTELQRHSSALMLQSYGCLVPDCALLFGLSYAPDLVDRVAPSWRATHFMYYGFATPPLFVFGEGWVPLDRVEAQVRAGRDVVFVAAGGMEGLAFKVKTLVATRAQSVYLITGMREPSSFPAATPR